MGLFGKMFEKKYCDVCGGDLGIVVDHKLADGNLCKECAKKLSPFFSGYKSTTLEAIKDQLDYREANKDRVAAFNVTRTYGDNTKLMIDEDKKQFIVTSASKWRDANPDVIDFSQVTGCNYEMKERKTEIKRDMPDGTKQSYTPPRYDYDYDFYVTINVNSPFFREIEFKVNNQSIDDARSFKFADVERQCKEIKETISGIQQEIREQRAAEAAPKQVVTCPYCGGITTPTANGCCEWCGAPVR